MKKITFLTIFFSLFLSGSLFSQEYVYVKAGGTGNGTTAELALGNFGAALSDINSEGDILRVIGDISLASGQNLSSKTFAFIIEGDSDLSTLTGTEGQTRMFTINGGTGHNVTFKNLIFTGATNSTGPGAVIGVFRNSTITIENCVFNGNSSTSITGGGAILINNSSANLTVNDTSFYQNSNTASNGQGGAIAILASASAALTNCTFFENKITRTDKNFGGAIRTNSTSLLTVTNCLFYNNKANNGAGGNSDVMGTGTSGRTITNSILQFTNNKGSTSYVNNNSTITDSDFLATSNLSWDATLNKVTFTAPNTLTNDTPIDFGTDTSDVGAYDSNINIFLGGTVGSANNWNTTTNWSNGALPTSTDNIAVLSGREVTLNTDATIVDLKVKAPIKINWGKSLIVTGEVTGDNNKVYYKRNLTAIVGDAEGWHLVASPVSGQTYNNAYADAESLATSTTNTSLRGLGFYATANDTWSYLVNDDSNADAFSSGSGYTMKRASTGQVKFIGNLNTDDLGVDATISTAGNGFNLLGNPYTAFINSQTFLTDNTNIEQQIWVWDQTGGGNYEVKIAGADFEIAPGQGFFVKAISGTAVNFAESNQSAQGTDTFLRTNSWTEVKLLMTDGEKNRFTKLYFTDNATTGFDAGWEGEVFGGIANKVDVFTELVSDNQGKNYQVQSLPISEMESMVIPVGVIAEAGKELIFSLEQTNFPTDVKVYLEDRIANTYNELTASNTFKVTLSEAFNDVGRFYLHASKSALNVNDALALNGVSMYKSNATTLKVVGLPNGTSNIKLFNILGKQVLNTSFIANGVKEITLPKLATGIYIVQLETETSKLNKKIVLE